MSGPRKSATTPRAARPARTASAMLAEPNRSDSWAPRAAGSRGVMISMPSPSSARARDSRQRHGAGTQGRHPDLVEDRQRRDERREGQDRVRRRLPACRALGRARTVPSMSNRRSGSVPHQPASRGRDASRPCRSWTNSAPIEPGPPLRYLYVHHAAKSTSQSWSSSAMLPAAWARSQPTTAPAAWPAAVSRSMSRACPVAKFTPARKTSASSSACSAIAPSRSLGPERSPRRRVAPTTMRSADRIQPARREVAGQGVPVGREERRVDEDPPPLALRPEERGQQQVDVDGQRVEERDLGGTGADDPSPSARAASRRT